MKQVELHKVIGLNKLQYINLVDGQFNIWCEDLSYRHYVPMRELIKNASLYNWFLKRWNSDVVSPFLLQVSEYLENDIKDPDSYQNIFHDYIENPRTRILGTYPSVLLKTIKKEHYKSISKNDQ